MEQVEPLSKNLRIAVAGASGLVGSAIVRELASQGYEDIVALSSADIDLTDRSATFAGLRAIRPSVVIDSAARVGGVLANSRYPADFLSENLQIQANLLDGAAAMGVRRLLFLGSSCIYPRLAAQPMKEEYLLSGALEPTNSGYAVAKIAGIYQVLAYRLQHGLNWNSAMPTNIYGPGDNFHPEHSHVIPALIRRFHEAKISGATEVVIWGSGTPMREFLYSADLARAVVFLLNNYDSDEIINVGSGQEVSIRELAETVAEVVDYQGELVFDSSKPDGTPRKFLDNSKIEGLGWKAEVGLKEGLATTYAWFVENEASFRGR